MKQEHKANCWEFMKCGREPGGIHSADKGVCPATVETGADGINGGRNGGRCCWVIAGTFCFGEVQGTTAKKSKNCMDCVFYLIVANEESEFFSPINSFVQIYPKFFRIKGLLRGLSHSILSKL